MAISNQNKTTTSK